MIPAYKRIMLKMSGEALMGNAIFGIDPTVLDWMAAEVKTIITMKVQLGIVVGGGNLFRGAALSAAGLGRITGDHMGMLATVMNALALRDALERADIPTHIMSAVPMVGVADAYDRRKAIHRLSQGRVVIFAGGTGNPLCTTDSAASLRAIEVEADILLKATTVEGVYSDDPNQYPNAKLFEQISFKEVLEKELGIMDLAAFCQCRDYNVPIRVFKLQKEGALKRIVLGQAEGTLVANEISTIPI